MKCLNPIRLFQDTPRSLLIRCGVCIACRQNYAQTWAGRMAIEHYKYPCAYFVGLNYADINLVETKQGYPTLVKKHVQLFIKRLRKTHSFRYYLSGEYSQVMRPHYHLAIFYKEKMPLIDCINHIWKSWYYSELKPDVRPLDTGHYTYITKYLVKRLNASFKDLFVSATGCTPEFSLMSKKPFFGYLEPKKIARIVNDRGIFVNNWRYPVSNIYTDKFKNNDPENYEKFKKERDAFLLEANKKQPILTSREKKRLMDFHERRELWKRSIIKM